MVDPEAQMAEWKQHGVVQGSALDWISFDQWDRLADEAERVQADPERLALAEHETQNRPQAKAFLKQWLGRWPVYDPTSIWADIANTLAPYASEYLQDEAILRFYNLLDVTPSDAPPSRSQLWHQDQEDRRIVKAFLYLTDVGHDAGPLYYAKGTQLGGAYSDKRRNIRIYSEPVTGWARATDGAVEAVVPRSEWHIALGQKGSMLLADTAGYHRGGHATGNRRLSAVWAWTTKRDRHGSRFGKPDA